MLSLGGVCFVWSVHHICTPKSTICNVKIGVIVTSFLWGWFRGRAYVSFRGWFLLYPYILGRPPFVYNVSSATTPVSYTLVQYILVTLLLYVIVTNHIIENMVSHTYILHLIHTYIHTYMNFIASLSFLKRCVSERTEMAKTSYDYTSIHRGLRWHKTKRRASCWVLEKLSLT